MRTLKSSALLAILGFATIGSPLLFAPEAHASSDEFYGTVTSVTSVEDGASFVLRTCDDENMELHMRLRGEATSQVIEKHMNEGSLVRVRLEENAQVKAIANIPGGDCDNLPRILDALEDREDDDTSADSPRARHRGMMGNAVRLAVESNENRHEMGHDLKLLLRERFEDDGELDENERAELKLKLHARARMHNFDDRSIEIENETGLVHENVVRIRALRDEREHPIRMAGVYEVRGDLHVLLNPHGRVMAELKVDAEDDFNEFVGSRVLVQGTAHRQEKLIDVSSMTEHRAGGMEVDTESKWKVGASLYHDIDSSDERIWFARYLHLLYDRGIFTGYSDGSFGAGNDVTLAEISKIIAEAANHSVDADANAQVDMSAKMRAHWASKYLRHAIKYSLLSDMGNPDRSATRAEVVRAILTAYGYTEAQLNAEVLADAFLDTDDKFVLKAYALGIIGGYDDGSFRPSGKINRAEVAKIITRAIEVLGEDDESVSEADELLDEVEDMNEAQIEGLVETD